MKKSPHHLPADPDTLRAQFRELSTVEEDFKRYITWANENLKGLRELKHEIQKQIFGASAETALPGNAATTINNGPTHN